jgi:exosortase A
MLLVGLVLAALAWIIGWHATTAEGMISTWWRSETFAHGLIIYPVSAWLIWRKRSELAMLPVKPCFLALVPFAIAAFITLLGSMGGVEAAKQFGLVAMLALAVVVIMGLEIARAIAFPLAFTLLAVPLGEFLLPILMQHTADFTVAALRLSGIPVYREGLFFTVPSGRWSVVEACSGLRYLIASITLGLLYAYLTYTSLWRRALFIFASILVPIVANWLRAYMIVMIGHLSGMRYAVGVDHLIYGWVFFGVVMLALFWIGSWWREDRGSTAETSTKKTPLHWLPNAWMIVGAVGVAALASVGPLYAKFLDGSANGTQLVLPKLAPSGDWVLASTRLPAFTPHFMNARSTIHESYEREGRQVGLFIAYYARQSEGTELVSFGNDLVTATAHGWARLSEKRRSANGVGPDVLESRLTSERGPLVAWYWYWAGGKWTVHPEEVKLRQAFDRLTGRGDDAAVVVVYTQPSASLKNDDSASALKGFVSSMEPWIQAALETTRKSRVLGARASAAR